MERSGKEEMREKRKGNYGEGEKREGELGVKESGRQDKERGWTRRREKKERRGGNERGSEM